MAFDNETLEAAAQLLERLGGNDVYMRAWKAGAKRIRGLKKLTSGDEKLTDNPEQITSHSR